MRASSSSRDSSGQRGSISTLPAASSRSVKRASSPEVEHVTFSGRRAREKQQDVTYVTERCVIRLADQGLTVTEIAPGVDLARDVLAQAGIELKVAPEVKTMDARLFRPEPMGLALSPPRR